jgi:hypothetical protein
MAINRSELPVWYGQRRGISLAAFAEEDAGVDEEDNDGPWGRLGYFLVALALPLVALALALAATHPPLHILIPLAFLGASCLGIGVYTAAAVLSREEPPAWASVVYQLMAAIGQTIVWTFLIVSLLIVVIIIVGFIFAALSSHD